MGEHVKTLKGHLRALAGMDLLEHCVKMGQIVARQILVLTENAKTLLEASVVNAPLPTGVIGANTHQLDLV